MNRSVVSRSGLRWLLVAIILLSVSAASFGQIAVGISVRVGPPPLPVYAQPICPGPGYFWTPGYWAWNEDAGYYWVPGTWVVAPIGMLWTPGYWGWGGGFYVWHGGYWGPHVGFYGGINYGYGYGGEGFGGGEWRGRSFYYNRSVTNVSVTNVTNVYNKTVIVNNNSTTSFNGGARGVPARPTPQEEMAAREQHVAPLATQTQHEHLASQNRQNFASENHGRPAIAATARAGDFSSRSVVAARAAGGEYHAPAMSPKEARGPSTPANRAASTPGNRGNSNQGFRPFTPPSKSASSAGNNRPQNNNRMNENNNRMNTSRPNQNESRPNGSRPNESRPQNGYHPAPQSRPANAPHPVPQPHQSSPPPHQSSPQPPKRESPQKEERKGGR